MDTLRVSSIFQLSPGLEADSVLLFLLLLTNDNSVVCCALDLISVCQCFSIECGLSVGDALNWIGPCEEPMLWPTRPCVDDDGD